MSHGKKTNNFEIDDNLSFHVEISIVENDFEDTLIMIVAMHSIHKTRSLCKSRFRMSLQYSFY